MRVATWKYGSTESFAVDLQKATDEVVQVDRHSHQQCLSALASGDVDFALVPTLNVLSSPADFSIVPGIGLASLGSFPDVKLGLRTSLDHLQTIKSDKGDSQAEEVTRVLVAEHYGQTPQFVGDDAADPNVPCDAELLVGEQADEPEPSALVLDIGSEWFELTAKPMVWGLLVSSTEALERGDYDILLSATSKAGSGAVEEAVDSYETGEVYTRLDEYALQGLEAFADYLFWTNRIDELPDLRFAAVPELANG